MATSGDVRDIMDLGNDGPRLPAPKKKKKQLDTQPRLTGISREVQALMGDSVPPVAIVEALKYKRKPLLAMKMFKPRHWEERQFVHGARDDSMELRHWKRSIPGTGLGARGVNGANGTPGDVEMIDGEREVPTATAELKFEEEFPSEKWNVQPHIRTYDDEQYNKWFKSDEWTKEETDHLMQLCKEYALRWILIADRYDPIEIATMIKGDTSAHPIYPERRMEELKQRYYTIEAKLMEVSTPASNMTQTEFQLWEKMRTFDARAELQRKIMAEKLFERTKEEADEEKVLLEELYRITKNEDDFIKMRKELYSRLETAPSLRRNERGEEPSTALYQTSQGLSMLLSNLLAKEKRLKPRAIPTGPEATATAQTPTDTQKSRQAPQNSRRETMESIAAPDDNTGSTKKAAAPQTPVVRTLTPAEEVKYGVSHPQERLTSGVNFRHEKINRLTMAKSQVQTQKIGAALTELGIPPRLLMPTERVCREFERLVGEVQMLLDTRRVLEKVSSEVKVLEEIKRIRLGGEETEQPAEDKREAANAVEIDTAANADEQLKQQSGLTSRAAATAPDATLKDTRPGSRGRDAKVVPDGVDVDEDVPDESFAEVEDSQVQGEDDDDDNDDDDVNDVDSSYARRQRADDGDEDEEDAEEAEEDEEDEETAIDLGGAEDEDEDDDAPGLEDLERANQVTDDEDEDIDQSRLAEEEDEEDEEEEEDDNDDEADVDATMLNGSDQDEVGGEDDEEDEDPDEDDNVDGEEEDEGEEDDDVDDEVQKEASLPTSSHSHVRSHKRSASVISDASRAGSNRSGASRKRRK